MTRPEVEEALRTALSNTSEVSMGSGMSFGASAFTASSAQNTSVTADPARLAELSDMLSRGDKREAAEYAVKRGLWSHALIISSSVDQELWADTVMRFAQADLQDQPNMAALKASYAVFSGKTATSGGFCDQAG
jgi:hypothetical protein